MTTSQRTEDATAETVPRQPFARARDRFIVHMRPEDVVADLGRPGETDEVVAAPDKLVDWGNLRADPGTSRVTSVEDFHRPATCIS